MAVEQALKAEMLLAYSSNFEDYWVWGKVMPVWQ